jgi:hypothetical protein
MLPLMILTHAIAFAAGGFATWLVIILYVTSDHDPDL